MKKSHNYLQMDTKLQEQNSILSVSHNMVLTMIDGKICNAVTSTTSAQVCYVCGAAPKQMNRID